MDKIKELVKICQKTQEELLVWLRSEMFKYYPASKVKITPNYLYVKGTLPVCLVAHLDTVHIKLPTQIYYDAVLGNLFSPQGIGGDDRCGVYIILELVKRGLRPSIIFCCDEEIGAIGAAEFTKVYGTIKNVNWFLEFDRKGRNDVVCYDDDNEELTQVFEKFGFKKQYGSFSDISELAPFYKISAVNVSSGYYNPHTNQEYIKLDDLDWIINTAEEILNSEYVNNQYTYIAYDYKVYGNYYDKYYGRYGGWADDDYYGDYTPSKSQCAICSLPKRELRLSEFGLMCDSCIDYCKMVYCTNCNMWVIPDDKGCCENCKEVVLIECECDGK